MKTVVFAFAMTCAALVSNQLFAWETKPQQTIAQTQGSAAVQKINLNTASAEQLALIPGIGQQKAEAIQKYIAEHGAIRSEQQLTEVRGIGPRLAETVAQYVHFEH
ncbi:helix-hairpin-helix domain-containing protein [Alkalimonas sp. MEB108]|uniref:Helix-hairpin-helix domain-containing protein n=1 Tax=Alkalimonas cellulosilytica TaxID=3058395 RepID=A0ABU7J225_9GAMM|nr:helix-hairpin-helix domain-containing protein [Alkalimonas sp. MEB108]MEE2000454.1 helix-hairpin-helix domain-containing protein [Alkalimonas sp. MEB108]